MRLNGISSLATTNKLQKLDRVQVNTTKKLSTGLRINSSSDDAAGLSLYAKMKSQSTSLDVVKRNIMDGASLVQTAEGTLDEIHNILNKVRALAVESENGIYTNQDKTLIVNQVKELKVEIEDIVNKASFNGVSLLQGDSVTIQTGINEDDTMTIETPNLTHLVRHLIVKDNPDRIADMSRIDSMIDIVSQARATLGAFQNRLEHSLNNINVYHENSVSAESRIVDADFAQEIATKTKQELMTTSAMTLIQNDIRGSSILNLLN